MDIHPNPGPISECIYIFYLHIRSLRNKIDYLSDVASDYDIVCITESHLDDNVKNSEIHIDGFYPDPIRSDRSRHGGVLLYMFQKIFLSTDLSSLNVMKVKISGQKLNSPTMHSYFAPSIGHQIAVLIFGTNFKNPLKML